VKMKMGGDNSVRMKIYPMRSSFPGVLFKDVHGKLCDAFGVDISYSIDYNSKYATSQTVEVQ